jgi:hypothetical protein
VKIRVTDKIPDDPEGWLGVTPGKVYEASPAPDSEVLIERADDGGPVWLTWQEYEVVEP